ncbi:tether containing UBX domain for GLUT4 [Anopheles marshallii]|uniref:tether containing UBX domain for GLUT4 n=1 Tax=Anopheles marshallii TaxID=1521116 RepID=UPI00237A2FE3|nr:tether containing UBX domain for GLUT4 [Anopheles marshallii]
MATRSVTVLTVHGRRQTVKVEPDMTMLEILETVCRKYNFPQDEYDLLHHNKVLDLTTMFRFAGVPNNALLEMAKAKQIRTEDDVIVQLQLEDGTRSENGTFKPSQTLLDVLMALCSSRATAEAHPVLVYMRREVYWEQLATTTLKSLGLTRGRAALRLLQRRAEEPKIQANVSAPLPQTVRLEEAIKPVTTVPLSEAPTAAADAAATTSLPEAAKPSASVPDPIVERAPERIDETKPVEEVEPSPKVREAPSQDTVSEQQQTDTPRPEAQIMVLGERDAVLYHASTAEREQAEVADSFFDLTVPEMMQLYKQLQDRVKSFEDAPLLTGELRELERNQQLLTNMNRYRQAVIRVQFPDRHILQGVFQVYESVGHVMEFVRRYLADSKQPFYLYTTPPKVVLQPTVSLLDAGCFPQVLLHFSYDHASNDSTSAPAGFCLQPELLERLSNATGASAVAARAKRNAAGAGVSQEGTTPTSAEPTVRISSEPMVAGPSNRIPHRNFRQSSSIPDQSTSEREAKLLKFLKK